ncbi:hypothetical protein PISMIDRAFT_16551 [Pisolithus microcarpus 441]|uniref:Unplaced genomic scaffold scaffold_209, whole genome shotgun sequence n=1 Tax=Pisolithus microcarpus 441 TaxID=765257 RepID=A0A0C9YN94_9AGAM|nr:hypothetical protein PISMIDRAFT_16551 [Pisolithus microcarpus 441]
MSSSATHPQMIVPWETALPEELEDKPGDSTAIKMARLNERQCWQCLALQQEIKAEEWRKAEEAKRVCREQEAKAQKKAEEKKRIRELEAEYVDDRDDEAMEDTLDIETVSCPQVLRMLPPQKDSMTEVLDRRLGEVMKLLQKNNTTIETLAKDIWDPSRVLEESFEALKATTTTLVNQAQNEEDV